MLIYLKVKLRTRWTQFRKNLQRRGPEYLIFHGSHDDFLSNGAWVLEESIALFHGKANPIHIFSLTDLNNMSIERIPRYAKVNEWWHKGSWDGRPVLVKMARYMEKEGLLREIVVATQMATHTNVHKLLGCCLEIEWPVLVYEWIEIETLEDYIKQNRRVVLKWKDRLRIAWEISHAISYLHNAFPRSIVHRFLNPQNVFLDHDGAVRLCNFNSCISIPQGEEFVKKDVMVGRLGYMAPEYCMHGEIAESIDVYSYGALLLTLVTSKTSLTEIRVRGQNVPLLTWVENSIKENCIIKVVDPRLIVNGVSTIEGLQLRASVHLALGCLVEEEDHRPSMEEVATLLKNMITYPESILDCSGFKERSFFRVFCGSKENFIRNKTMVIQESTSFYGKANPVNYFSVDDLNSMNVEFSVFCRHVHFNWYQGSWEGVDVLLKLPKIQMEHSRSSDEILLIYAREIVVATQMATHDNVHKLIGCCLETATPVLIYEWMSCETLRNRMHSKILPPLEWNDRLRIAWEISHVISYLHSSFPRAIVHRFLKPESIFLDHKRTAKICNFHHSVSILEGENSLDDMAPKYYNHGKAEKFTDVYSFGNLFLELLTGKQAKSTYLTDWITEEIRKDGINLIIDPAIIKNGATTTELTASIELALRCTVPEEDNRPTMEDISTKLNDIVRSSGSSARA